MEIVVRFKNPILEIRWFHHTIKNRINPLELEMRAKILRAQDFVANIAMVKRNAPKPGVRNNAVYVGQDVTQDGLRPKHAPFQRHLSRRRAPRSEAIVLSPFSSLRLYNKTLRAGAGNNNAYDDAR